MKTAVWTAMVLVLFAGALLAQPAASPPGLDAATGVLAYVPPDADLAVLVRMDALAQSDLWKRFRESQDGIYQKVVKDFHLTIDFEKDVSAAVCCLQIVYEEDGDPDDAAVGIAFALNRDIQPQTLFKNANESQPIEFPDVSIPVYKISRDVVVAVPNPRTVVMAMPKYLPAMLNAAGALWQMPPWPRRELAVPGEITFAARMPEKLKAAIRTEFEKNRRRLLKPNANTARVLEFAFLYNLVDLALDADTLAGSMNLADSEAALRATLSLGEGRLATATASVAQAMADPLAIALPALFGGAPLEKPPETPLYLIRADANAVRLTMSRANLEQLVAQMTAGAEGRKERVQSASNLRQIGKAAFMYRADHGGAWPATLAAVEPYVGDPSALLNPARTDHLPGGDYQLVPLTNEAAAGQPWAKVLAYEVLSRDAAPQEGLNVLFADGHVEYVAVGEFNRLYQETLRSLGR